MVLGASTGAGPGTAVQPRAPGTAPGRVVEKCTRKNPPTLALAGGGPGWHVVTGAGTGSDALSRATGCELDPARAGPAQC